MLDWPLPFWQERTGANGCAAMRLALGFLARCDMEPSAVTLLDDEASPGAVQCDGVAGVPSLRPSFQRGNCPTRVWLRLRALCLTLHAGFRSDFRDSCGLMFGWLSEDWRGWTRPGRGGRRCRRWPSDKLVGATQVAYRHFPKLQKHYPAMKRGVAVSATEMEKGVQPVRSIGSIALPAGSCKTSSRT